MATSVTSTCDIRRYEQIGSLALPRPNPSTCEVWSHVLHLVQLTSKRKLELRKAMVRRGQVT